MQTEVCVHVSLNFLDIDECEEGEDSCDSVRGHCLNIMGSFLCTCITPYWTGDGVHCTGEFQKTDTPPKKELKTSSLYALLLLH